jgi:hypothetical protein
MKVFGMSCAAVIVMFLSSSPGYCDILSDKDWVNGGSVGDAEVTGSSSDAAADAHGDGESGVSLASGYGHEYYWTTEECIAEWEYFIYTWADARFYLWEPTENSGAAARATASAECVAVYQYYSDDLYAEAIVQAQFMPLPPPWPQRAWLGDNGGAQDGIYRSWPGSTFLPGDGISVEHMVAVAAWVDWESQNTGTSHACTEAWGSMSQTWP